MSLTVDTVVGNDAPNARIETARALRPHLPVIAGQAAAGGGNLVFAVCVAKILGAGDYADVVTFLALYLLLHLPAAALSAAGALAPGRMQAVRGLVARAGLGVAAVLAIASVPISRGLGMPLPLVLALAAAAPGAGLLGLERGVAYGNEHHRALVRSLLTEPAVRVGLGIVLTLAAGAVGAAIAAVLAGYAALMTCAGGFNRRAVANLRGMPTAHRSRTVTRHAGGAEAAGHARHAVVVAASFVAIAVLQSIDLVIANSRLGAADAAQFAVLSTVGGAAVFATATIPMVLLPAAARSLARATSTAVGLTVAVGLMIAAVGALLADSALAALFGDDRTPSSGLVGLYLLAMAAIGMIRVLAAHRCATGDGRFTVTSIAFALAAEIVALVSLGDDVQAVVTITFVVSATLATALSFEPMVRQRVAPVERIPWRYRTGALAMIALCVVAADIRLATNRGLWVDEAISVRQAQLPFAEMLADMRNTDVHPPLHHALLWITVRLFGASELAVRLPSLIAGVALVPVMAWTGRVIYDRRTGWVAAALASVAPFCVWYSQEARMYALFMLFAALAVGAQVQAIRRGLRRDWLLYGVATAALIWTQYFAFLPVLVQQIAFMWVVWRDRRDRARMRSLVRGWLASMVLVLVALVPLVPILRAQFLAYSNRSSGLVPGQAGANSSTIGGAISIYAVGANLIWGIWGYHADGAMVQIAALWPLIMLLLLLLLGRGRSGPSLLLLALLVLPMAALFVIGSMKRDLFELRYFSGAVPATLLLGARLVTATTTRKAALLAAGGVLTATMAIGLVDQQLNGANPRLYDFEGALEQVHTDIRSNSSTTAGNPVLLYEPSYLGDVIAYYAPDVRALPLGSPLPAGTGAVYVLATGRVLNAEDTSAKVGSVLADLEQDRTLVDQFDRPNVRVWELR